MIVKCADERGNERKKQSFKCKERAHDQRFLERMKDTNDI